MNVAFPEGRTSSLRTVAVAAAITVAVWGLLHVFPAVRSILFLTFFATLLASILRVPIDALSKRVPRLAATLTTLAAVIVVVALTGYLAVPVAREQAKWVAERMPQAIDATAGWFGALSEGDAVERLGGEALIDSLTERLTSELGSLFSQAIPLAVGTVAALGTALVMLVLAFFFAHNPEAYVRGLVWLMPRDREEGLREVLAAAGGAMRGWALGTLVSMTIIGAATAIALRLLGIEGWLVLGVLAFVGEFIPFVGPLVAFLPAVAMGFAQSPTTGLYTAIVFVAIQQLEGNIVQPLVMKRAVRLQPGVLIIGQILFTTAFGFLGLLIVTPLLACAKAALRVGYVQRVLGKEGHAQSAALSAPRTL